jgi:hypothetical protein
MTTMIWHQYGIYWAMKQKQPEKETRHLVIKKQPEKKAQHLVIDKQSTTEIMKSSDCKFIAVTQSCMALLLCSYLISFRSCKQEKNKTLKKNFFCF